jgi:uncharacterized protein (TIGR03086 family)
METIDALDRSFAHTRQVIGAVTPEQWDAPTPCTEWQVSNLVSHTIGVVENMGRGLRGEELLGDVNGLALAPDVEAQFAAAAATTLAAWQSTAADAEVDIGAGPMPAMVAAGINLLDTTGHAWDIARATGQSTVLPADVVGPAMQAAQMIITDEVRGYAGFDPVAPVGDDASETDRFAAFLGRRL